MDEPDIDALVAAVLTARSPEAWDRSVDALGPTLLSDLTLIRDFHVRVAELRAAGNLDDAATLARWNRDVMERGEEDRVRRLLLGAESEEELDRLLEEHRSTITPALVESALRESWRLLTGQGPFPPEIAEQVVARILRVAGHVAGFLGEQALVARCLTMRSRIALVHHDYEAVGGRSHRGRGAVPGGW